MSDLKNHSKVIYAIHCQTGSKLDPWGTPIHFLIQNSYLIYVFEQRHSETDFTKEPKMISS